MSLHPNRDEMEEQAERMGVHMKRAVIQGFDAAWTMKVLPKITAGMIVYLCGLLIGSITMTVGIAHLVAGPGTQGEAVLRTWSGTDFLVLFLACMFFNLIMALLVWRDTKK